MVSVSQSMFLDRSKVFKALDRKRQVVLLRTGGYTRKIMRNSMKRAPKRAKSASSTAGKPPFYRVGTLRNKIGFGFDESTQSVVVGTEQFNTKTKPAGGKTTAELLNEGGAARISTPAGVTRASYAPRPFTPPAEEAGVRFFNDLIEKTPLK